MPEDTAVANIIKGNQDGPNGENESYSIPGRGSHIPRKMVVRGVKQHKHPHHSTYKLNGKEYIRAKPDSRTNNNVNQ
jgi:hypothetical protein